MSLGTFAQEYDLDALVRVRPRGHTFSMLVTPRYRHHFEVLEYEPFSARLLAAALRRARLFVDVGAHYGFFALLAATRNPGLDVLALEPVPESFEILRRNLGELGAGARVAVERAAVSDSDGTARFQVSLASDSCGFYAHPNAGNLREIDVRCLRLDTALAGRTPCPAVVKIDTEGHELAVLRGMSGTLARFPDLTLLVEFCPRTQEAGGAPPEALLRELDRLGFVAFLLDEERGLPLRLAPDVDWRSLLPAAGYANLYCVRKERALSVCFFSHSAYLNGAERELLDLTSSLVADHSAVCTVVLPEEGPLREKLGAAGVGALVSSYPWWCTLPPATPGPELSRGLHAAAATFVGSLLPALRDLDPDVVATQTLTIPWGAAAAAFLGKPHVWSVTEFGRLDHDLRFALPFEEVLEEIAASSALVLTPSEAVRRALFPSLPRERCRPLLQHVEVPEPPATPAPRRWFQRAGAVRLASFGALWPGKGQEDLVRAVARLVRGGRDVELLLAGSADTDYRRHLDALASELGVGAHVRVAGFVDDPFAAMREADVLVQCSRSEAFGRAAVEAMLLGKPLVFAAAGGFLEFLEDGTTGLAYPPGDDAALAERLERLVAHPEEAAQLGRAARESARARFTADAFGGEFFRAARALAAEGSPPPRLPSLLQGPVGAALSDATRRIEQEHVRAAARDGDAVGTSGEDALREAEALRADLRARQAELELLRHELAQAQARAAPGRAARTVARWGRSYRKRRAALAQLLRARPPPTQLEQDRRLIAESGEFDREWYLLQNPDVAAAGMDPLEHFLLAGAREGRSPSRRFDVAAYLRLHPEIARDGLNPLAHELRRRRGLAGPARPAQSHVATPLAAPAARAPLRRRARLAPMPKVIAWHLPQFHPIPENDAWWGPGFTEWRSVVRARPLFAGHHQPQLPADLGFYDLRLRQTRADQARLARRYGIHGFAYHFYWFEGRQVLESPLRSILRSGEPDFPFCLSWANENWTRRWDGQESHVLLRQEHHLATDVRFFRDVLPYLRDARYLRHEGKPVLIVYRADLMRDPPETAAAWRDEARRAGLPGLHLCAVQFRVLDPTPLGFDALIEFPPHHFPAPALDPAFTSGLPADFEGRVLDYRAGVRAAMAPAEKPFPFYRGAMPGWDNTARRGNGATVFHGATPELYGLWLQQLAIESRHSAQSDEHFLFVNAWNEWAEGAHLEPDDTFGLGWLEATRRALRTAADDDAPEVRLHAAPTASSPIPWSLPAAAPAGPPRRPVLLVSHDAARAGAQLVLLRLVERLARHDRLEPWVVLRHGGVLEPDFRRIAPTVRVDEAGPGLPFRTAAERIVADMAGRRPLLALCNTVVSSDLAELCDAHGIPVLSHVHELPTSIASLGEDAFERVLRHSRRVIVVSEFVRRALCGAYGAPAEKLTVLHNGIAEDFVPSGTRDRARAELLRGLGFPPDAFVVLGCGSIHARKGPDLFVQAAIEAARLPGAERLRFAWLGEDQAGPALRQWCEHDLAAAGLGGRVVFAGGRADPAPVFASADAFALTSREDPFPTVSLEAMAAGLPVVAFEGAGGAPEAFEGGAGLSVPYLDVDAMARALVALATDPGRAAELGARARRRIADRFGYERFFAELMALVERDFGGAA